jgi:nitrogen regulatory protein A
MKTGKRMIIANVGLALGPEEKIDYPILLSESLTALVPMLNRH